MELVTTSNLIDEGTGEASLLSLSSDISKAAYLDKLFRNTTTSYKFYWLKAVIDEVCAGHVTLRFDDIAKRMVMSAWYTVLQCHVSLGLRDRIAHLATTISELYDVPANIDERDLSSALDRAFAEDDGVKSQVRDLSNYVPYRLIRPFYSEEVNALLRRFPAGKRDTRTNKAILEANAEDPDRCLYVIVEEERLLRVNEDWRRYVLRDEAVIRGWLDLKLAAYLQSKNPSVPAILLKLRPPKKRNLESATAYWRSAAKLIELEDIYTGRSLESAEWLAGVSEDPVGIDHFLPWAFVLHDEAWNLTPVERSVNSSKSDRLPAIDLYLEPFCKQQFNALMAIKGAGLAGRHRRQFDSYRLIDPDVDGYVESDVSFASFERAVRSTIVPLYQIALNQGFDTWEYVA